MQTLDTVYDISRYYVEDHRHGLGDLADVLLGYIRSRDLVRLTSCGDLFDLNRHTVDEFRHLRQVASFFKKNADFSNDEECSVAAFQSFLKAEECCRITNRRLDWYYTHLDRLDPDMREYLSRMERFIHRTLGRASVFLEGLPSRIRVTPGATATRSLRRSLPYMKMSSRPVCTPGAVPYLRALYSYHGYMEPRCKTINWNRVEIVPKNWKTGRTIACEPGHNIPFQLAFDDFVKAKLRRHGIDLSDQSLNQRLARQGSIDGTLCTIDLSAASDSLAVNTIHWLFPSEWCEFLFAFRSSFYRFNGKIGRYAKFSSMGNGMTFGLETLVFAAACHATQPSTFSVYGDDIIIDTDKYEVVTRILAFLGFKVNEDKSYHEGPFRESCGGDFFNGVDVTPFYLRKWVSKKGFKPLLSHNVNGLVGICLPGGSLENLCLELVESNGLPLVPYNEVSTSGIWIDVTSAYSHRKIRNRSPWIPAYKGYVSKTPYKTVRSERTFTLWCLQKHRREKIRVLGLHGPDPDSVTISSKVPAGSHFYVRKWVCWIPPATVTPLHLYRWSDHLLRKLGLQGPDSAE